MEGRSRGKKPKTPPRRIANRQGEGHEAREGVEETGKTEYEEGEEEGDRGGETPQGAPVEVTCVEGGATPPEENTDLPVFAPERVHLLL